MQDHLVPQLREGRLREIVGLGLDLLQTDDVRPTLFQPDTDEVQTGAQTVHVPGCDTHAGILTDFIQQRADGLAFQPTGSPWGTVAIPRRS